MERRQERREHRREARQKRREHRQDARKGLSDQPATTGSTTPTGPSSSSTK
jgi:hypothetical protein